MKNKFKSYSFWTALSAAIVVLIEALGRICGFIPDGKLVADIIMAVAGVLVVLGVVSAPINNDENKKVEDITDIVETSETEKVEENDKDSKNE